MDDVPLWMVLIGCICLFASGWCLGWYCQPRYTITVKSPDVYLSVTLANGGVQEWRFVDDADWWKKEGGKPPGEE